MNPEDGVSTREVIAADGQRWEARWGTGVGARAVAEGEQPRVSHISVTFTGPSGEQLKEWIGNGEALTDERLRSLLERARQVDER